MSHHSTKLFRLFPLVLVLPLLTACDPVPIADRLGVTMSSSDTPTVLFESCPGELVTTVSLIQSNGELGDDDDQVLWRITSPEGSQEARFPVGTTPSGFEEEVPLSSKLPRDRLLTAHVATSDGSETAAAFDLAALKEGSVTTALGELTRNRFESEAGSSC